MARVPHAGLVQGSDGNFYGTTVGGGTNGPGTVFKISATGALTTLYSFTGGKDGEIPSRAGAGQRRQFLWHDFNGGTNGLGTVFKISATGALTTLYSFTGGNDGGYPEPGWCRAATAISMARLTAAAWAVPGPFSG